MIYIYICAFYNFNFKITLEITYNIFINFHRFLSITSLYYL